MTAKTGDTTVGGKSRRSAVSTTREESCGGSTEASTPVKRIERNGTASTTSSAVAPIATGTGRRISACASRYQPPRSPRAARSAARRQRRGESAFTRSPSRTKSAGRTVSEISPASGATSPPAMPIERRKPSGKIASVAIAAATVTELKATVRPAVAIVRRTASAPGPSRASSSR